MNGRHTINPIGHTPRPLRVESVARLTRAQRPETLVDRILARKSVTIVAGAPYVGKTFFALEAMRAVVDATGFLGHFKVPKPGNVLYLGNDSPDWDIASQFGKLVGLPDPKLEDVERLVEETSLGSYGFIFESGFMLNTAEDAERVVDAAKRRFTMRDFNPMEETYRPVRGTDLIVLDTLRSLHGFEENSNTEMQHVMNLLRYIANQTGAAVMGLHHFNKAPHETQAASLDRLRGATAIGGAVDTVFALTGKAPSIAVRVLKHRPFPEQSDFMYEIGGEPGEIKLALSSSDGVVNLEVRNTILYYLDLNRNAWSPTSAIQGAVAVSFGIDPKSPKAAKATNRALMALEKSGNVVRIHGAARLADVQPKEES